MSPFKKMMSYLGLGPDDAYDDYDLPLEPERPAQRSSRSGYDAPETANTVRTIPARPATRENPIMPRTFPASEFEPGLSPAPRVSRQGSAVRTVQGAGQSRPHTVRPRRFDQAQEVADRYKEGQPVIVNLQDVDRDLSRRLIDFASGLCYGLGGTMEKVANGVYLLTPVNATVSAEDRRLLGDHDDL